MIYLIVMTDYYITLPGDFWNHGIIMQALGDVIFTEWYLKVKYFRHHSQLVWELICDSENVKQITECFITNIT